MGDLDFETAYETFKEVMILGEKAGADLIHIETMSDTYELKAAVLAAKENTSLPVFATTIFDERGKLLTGADVPSVVAMLEGLRIDALGINCGMGPEQMLPILEQIMKYSSVPVIFLSRKTEKLITMFLRKNLLLLCVMLLILGQL